MSHEHIEREGAVTRSVVQEGVTAKKVRDL